MNVYTENKIYTYCVCIKILRIFIGPLKNINIIDETLVSSSTGACGQIYIQLHDLGVFNRRQKIVQV
jgi:hypothetical protein